MFIAEHLVKRPSLLLALSFFLIMGCEPPGSDDAFDLSDAIQLPNSDGPGGFVNNPENSRDTLKVIWPTAYSDMISKVETFISDGTLIDILYRAKPDEDGDRERYYGTMDLNAYPQNLIVRATLTNETAIYVKLPVPQRRYD
ncbi:MAG: hypothetical protein PHI84_21435 [Kiritimatiellae bacterium]|nr:hypothetical protein [Kiritimatiellia bacterium]